MICRKILQIQRIYTYVGTVYYKPDTEDECVKALFLTICDYYRLDEDNIKLLIQAIKITTTNSLLVGTFMCSKLYAAALVDFTLDHFSSK